MSNKQTNNVKRRSFEDIDQVIHSPARTRILTYLDMFESASFIFLMSFTELTWGNMSVQLIKLEKAGYIIIEKEFRNKKPRTIIHITDEGRTALRIYYQNTQQLNSLPQSFLYPILDKLKPEIRKSFFTNKKVNSYLLLYNRILREFRNPLRSSKSLADVMRKDKAFNSKIINLVRSPIYGFPDIESLDFAITMIGERQLLNCLNIYIRKRIIEGKNTDFHKQNLKHSLVTAKTSSELGKYLKLSDSKVLLSLEISIFHNFSHLFLHDNFIDSYNDYINNINRNDIKLKQEIETKIFGCSLFSISALLLSQWSFPEHYFIPIYIFDNIVNGNNNVSNKFSKDNLRMAIILFISHTLTNEIFLRDEYIKYDYFPKSNFEHAKIICQEEFGSSLEIFITSRKNKIKNYSNRYFTGIINNL